MKIEFDDAEVMAWFESMSEKSPEVAQEAADALAKIVYDEAKNLVPVDTGELKESIKLTEDGEGSVELEITAPYAAAVEYGTSRKAPQPYLEPAIRTAEAQMDKIVRQVLEQYD